MPKVQLLICERIDLPEHTVGITIILGAADGEIVGDADVQKAALRVIVNCVCGPINRFGSSSGSSVGTNILRVSAVNSPTKRIKGNTSEELIEKVWECVRANSGIMVLLQLMNVKTPITDADSMRTLACKALAGLARSETVRQILSKLPIFTNGQLQSKYNFLSIKILGVQLESAVSHQSSQFTLYDSAQLYFYILLNN